MLLLLLPFVVVVVLLHDLVVHFLVLVLVLVVGIAVPRAREHDKLCFYRFLSTIRCRNSRDG